MDCEEILKVFVLFMDCRCKIQCDKAYVKLIQNIPVTVVLCVYRSIEFMYPLSDLIVGKIESMIVL